MGKCCPGGIVSYASTYGRMLEARGFDVHYCVEGTFGEEYEPLLTADPARLFRMPSIKQLPRYLAEYEQLFREQRFDIVHGLLNTLNPFVMHAAKKAGVPVRIAENLSMGHRLEPKTVAKNMLKPFARTGCTAYAANSELAGEWLYGRAGMADCFIINNPIDATRFHPNAALRETVRKAHGWDGALVVGCIARFEAQKNHMKLVEVFEALHQAMPEARLALQGHGSKEQEVRDAIAQKGLQGAVDFFDPSYDLPSFYNGIDCFVLTSLYEGLPMVSVEAQATGVPCVMSSNVTRECALSNAARFVPLDEPAPFWAETIVGTVAECPRDMTAESFKLSRFNAETAADNLAGLYRNLLKERA